MVRLSGDNMYVIVAGRRNGKTTKALEWLELGERVPQYPFWSRVLVTATQEQATLYRNLILKRAEGQDSVDERLLYNKVYAAEEWRRAHIDYAWKGEIAIDNVEQLLQQMLRCSPSLITMTGQLLNDRDPRTI